jgi:hypothetical protein
LKQNISKRYLATTFYVLYERDEISHLQEPKVNFDDSLLARIWAINIATKSVYTFLQDEPEDYQAYFEAVSAKHNASKKCDVVMRNYELSQIEKIIGDVKKAVDTSNKRSEKSLMCIEVSMGEMKATYYLIVRPMEGRKGKSEIIVFLLDHYEGEFNKVVLSAVNEAKGNDSEIDWMSDYARHNGLYEYNKISLGCWASLVMEKGFDPIDAFRLISYSLIPYFCEYKK